MKKKSLFGVLLSLAMLAGCSAPSAGAGTEEGDSVVVQIDADLNTMDHHIATDASSFIMQSMCFSGLTSLMNMVSRLESLPKAGMSVRMV